jgi:hypothetical protein
LSRWEAAKMRIPIPRKHPTVSVKFGPFGFEREYAL